MKQILPGDFYLFSDIARIKTRCPHEAITDKMILGIVRRERLPAGEPITVQCFNHDGSELLAEREYRVVKRQSYFHSEDITATQNRQSQEYVYTVEARGDWWLPWQPAYVETGRYVDGDARAVWNPGRKVHEVKVGDDVVATHRDRDTAHRIAAGELPLPAEAA